MNLDRFSVANCKNILKSYLFRDFLLILTVTLVVFLVTLGNKPIAMWDEGLYCGVTQDMQRHQTWLLPTLNGNFFSYYGKPPFVNWLQLLTTNIMGWSRFSLRFPTALGMIVQVLLIWGTGVILAGRWVGLVAVCLLLVSRSLVDVGQTIWLENLLTPLFAATFLCYGKNWRISEKFSLSGTFLAGIFTGLAVLTKQSFGLLPAIAIFIAEIIWRNPGIIHRLFVYGMGLILSCSWLFIYTFYSVGNVALDSWFGLHTAQRLTQALYTSQARQPSSFVQSLEWMFDAMPWVFGVIGWLALWRMISRQKNAQNLMAYWTILVIVEYLIVGVVSKTLLSWYQLVIAPPFLIGCAYIMVDAFTNKTYPFWIRWSLPLLIITNRLTAVNRDALLATFILLLGIYVYEKYQLKQYCKGMTIPLILLIFSSILALRSTLIAREDVRSFFAEEVRDKGEQVVAIADQSYWILWKCYLPNSPTFWAGLPCNELQKNIINRQYIVTEGKVPQCALGEFKPMLKKRNITLWKRA